MCYYTWYIKSNYKIYYNNWILKTIIIIIIILKQYIQYIILIKHYSGVIELDCITKPINVG